MSRRILKFMSTYNRLLGPLILNNTAFSESNQRDRMSACRPLTNPPIFNFIATVARLRVLFSVVFPNESVTLSVGKPKGMPG
jgi:hypothetical protein